MAQNPHFVLLFSGKRKSGKDYLVEQLIQLFDQKHLVCKITLSEPLKTEYAKIYGLDTTKLLDSSSYKEEFRNAMIKWGEKIRGEDPGYFCKKAIEYSNAEQFPVWVISDTRRQTDLAYFQTNYGDRVKTVRVVADDDVRKQRQWIFTPGIDDAESECGLDNVSSWNWVISNNGDTAFTKTLQEIKDKAEAIIPPIFFNIL